MSCFLAIAAGSVFKVEAFFLQAAIMCPVAAGSVFKVAVPIASIALPASLHFWVFCAFM